jgi:hypothetical protein
LLRWWHANDADDVTWRKAMVRAPKKAAVYVKR